jgi:uncharacterized protein (UPF0128 family)
MEKKEPITIEVDKLSKEEADQIYKHLSSIGVETELVSIRVENCNKGYHNEYYVRIIIPEEE